MGYEVNSWLKITGFSNEEQKNLIFNELNKVIKRYNRHDMESTMPKEGVYMNDGWSELKKKEWYAYLKSFMHIISTKKSKGELDIYSWNYKYVNDKEVKDLSHAYPNLNFFLSINSGEANFHWFILFKDGKELQFIGYGNEECTWELETDISGIMKLEKNGKGYLKKYEESNKLSIYSYGSLDPYLSELDYEKSNKPSIDSNVSIDPYLSELDDDEIPF